jgi:hypothetical protein
VRTFSVVIGEVERDRKVALFFCGELVRVQALLLDRAVEAFDPAIGPGVVRLGAGVTQAERGAVLMEGSLVSRAVVGEDALHADPPRVKERYGRGHEGCRLDVAAAGTQLDEAEPTGEIDRDVQLPPAHAVAPALAHLGMPATTAVQSTQALGKTDENVRATVLSTTSVSSALGQVTGGPISGAIGNGYGIPLGVLSSALMLLPGTLFFGRAIGLRAARGYRERSGPVAPSPSP